MVAVFRWRFRKLLSVCSTTDSIVSVISYRYPSQLWCEMIAFEKLPTMLPATHQLLSDKHNAALS